MPSFWLHVTEKQFTLSKTKETEKSDLLIHRWGRFQAELDPGTPASESAVLLCLLPKSLSFSLLLQVVSPPYPTLPMVGRLILAYRAHL